LKAPGSSRAEIAERRQIVYPLHLHHVPSTQIAERLGISPRTIERDIQKIEADLNQSIANENLRSLKRAYAELDEPERQAWIIFNRALDDSLKLAALDRILKIQEMKNRLVGLYQPKNTFPQRAAQTSHELNAAVAKLSEEERISLARTLQKLENTQED